MKNPPHPGTLLREDVFVPLNLSVTEAAERLAMSRVALSRVLNGRAAISPDLAIRLERAGVSTARFGKRCYALRSVPRHDLRAAANTKDPRRWPCDRACEQLNTHYKEQLTSK